MNARVSVYQVNALADFLGDENMDAHRVDLCLLFMYESTILGPSVRLFAPRNVVPSNTKMIANGL